MKSLINETLQQLMPDIVKIRHQIHSQPELAHKENETSKLIIKTLKKFGYKDISILGGTGVVTLLDSGKPGKTVALRADMDALPIQEKTNLPYSSKHNGIMHACGHDGHTATLLAVAGTLIENKHLFQGKIKFIFQPAEETGTGAPAMIKDGVLENPAVDAIFGYHNTPKSDPGKLVVKSGCLMAGQDTFIITIKGKGGLAAHPDTTTDPIYIGSLIIQTIQSIVSRFSSPIEPIVISVTQFHAGTTHNVIPDDAFLNGSIRTVSRETQIKVKERLIEIVTNISKLFGATANIEYQHSFPPTINHPNETELVLSAAKKILNQENIINITQPSMASEDFSHYLEKIPGCFFFIGRGIDLGPIHNATYQFNDEIIPIAAELMIQIALDYLNMN